MDSFKKRVKDIMQNKGLKQSDLAKMTGIAEATISRYCNGRRTPNIKALVKIAKILNVSTDYLLGIKDDNGKWIPCSERLPEKNKLVLGWYKDNPFSGYTYGIVMKTKMGWVFDYGNRYCSNVAAWMPLPELYKEGEDE